MKEPRERLYYKMGDVAKILGVNSSLIRFWEKEIHSFRPKKNMSGTRFFTKEDIERLKYIYHLAKTEGHTLEAVNRILKQKENQVETKYNAIKSLEKMKDLLVTLRNEIV
jgi:DNA-binding transcriptional MerR regulator